jgi:hypothetical protein
MEDMIASCKIYVFDSVVRMNYDDGAIVVADATNLKSGFQHSSQSDTRKS